MASSPKLSTIQLFLNNPKHAVPIAVYKEMPVPELQAMICSTLRIPAEISITGIQRVTESNEASPPIIPLSYLSRNPSSIKANDKYEIITNIGRYQPESSFLAKHWKSMLLLILCSTLLLYTLPNYFLMHRRILRNIYLNGPNYKIPILSADIGFWSGKQQTVICAEISGQSSEFWSKNYAECQQLLEQKLQGFVILIELTVTVYCVIQIIRLCIRFLIHKLMR